MRNALILFGAMALAQWLLPLWTIRERESVLREGTPFLFRTAPVDPHDPFRGEYVALRFALEDSVIAQPDPPFAHDEETFVVLGTMDGAASIASVLRTAPTDTKNYLRCKTIAWPFTMDSLSLRVELPFDRFYLEESTGRRTEDLMQQRNVEVGPELPSYAVVRVLNGAAVIEDLRVGDRSIQEWMREK